MKKAMVDTEWVRTDVAQALIALNTTLERGLTTDDVDERRRRYGRNLLTVRAGKGPLIRFLLQFHQPLIYVLLIAAAVTVWLKEFVIASVILGVVLLNAIIGFVQESRAIQAISALVKSIVTETKVIRDGLRQRLASKDLIPGDIVVLAAGDKVPADMRLLQVHEMRIAEAALTGESLPVDKSTVALSESVGLADQNNMAFSSTLVTSGQGIGLVTATGDSSEISRISHLINTADELVTPLTKRLTHLSMVMLWMILMLAGLNFMVGCWWHGKPPVEMLLASVALPVSAIPEGLSAALTITLAIGVARMAKRKAIIRKLPPVETLAGTTAIARQMNPIDESQTAITGKTLAETSDQELPDLAEKNDVFARVTPEHKIRLVRALQLRGHIVGLTLAFEPREKTLMQRPPRDPQSPILNQELIMRTGLLGLLLLAGAFGVFWWMLAVRHASPAEARTVAVNVFILGSIGYLLNCRSFTQSVWAIGWWSNVWLPVGVLAMLLFQLAFNYVPFTNRIFHSAPVDALSWIAAAAIAFTIYTIVGFEKWLRFGSNHRKPLV